VVQEKNIKNVVGINNEMRFFLWAIKDELKKIYVKQEILWRTKKLIDSN
jgi:hypothetical protein